jgi:hypothetical protein
MSGLSVDTGWKNVDKPLGSTDGVRAEAARPPSADPRSTDAVTAEPSWVDADRPPADVAVPDLAAPELDTDLGADADLAISLPDHDDAEYDLTELRRAQLRAELRMSRLRLCSYCLTLFACVLALMTFMYVTQGEADRDPTFFSLGVMFAGGTGVLLWAAVRVTRVEHA